jgi:tetratricopeptide (TPR) repeat protein
MKVTFYFLCLILFFSCGTGARLHFQTEPPRADIYVKPLDSGEFKKIGVTPALIRSSDIDEKNGGSGPLYVEFRKPGYKTKSILVTEMSAVDLTIDRSLEVESGLDDQRNINWVIDTMFEVKDLVQMRDFGKAIKLIDNLKKMVPQVAAVYELEGGVYFLQRQYKRALDSYRLAARYNPRNPENIRMRDLLEERLGEKDSPSILQPQTLSGEAVKE